MKTKHFIIIYFLVAIFEMMSDILLGLKGIPYGIWTFKPLLMPILMYWYYKETNLKRTFDKIILASLFFSWWGDIFLMPEIFKTDINFLLGLASFLIAHILYIVAFMKTNIEAKSILKKQAYLAIIFMLYGILLVKTLFTANKPGFLDMSIPVIVYAAVIMIMVSAAINRYGKVIPSSFKWVLIGALLFMFSDTFIALNRFTYIFENHNSIAPLIIMPLYVLAQYLIIKGCILQHGNSN